jgi:hypothetical protein
MTMLQEIVVLTVAYVVLVGLFQPKKKTAASAPIAAEIPIDYFPEVEEEVTEELVTVEEVAGPKTEEVTLERTQKPSVVIPADLENLTIRQLKKLASACKLPRYSSLTKAQLIARLSSLEVEAVAKKAA